MLLQNQAHTGRIAHSLRRWIVEASFVLSLASGQGQEIKLEIAPPPKWVSAIAWQTQPGRMGLPSNEEMRWLLKDRQINAQSNATFVHEALQFLTPASAARASDIAIDFDPGYQTLTFHWARTWRGANSLNRLAPERIVAGPRPAGLGDFLFSGKKSALLVLDDVRAGDVIEYAYTVQGTNPALGGRFVDSLEMQASQPVERLVTRLLWPSSRRFYIQNHGTEVKPSTSVKGANAEYTWDLRKAPGLVIEPPLPNWYTPLPWVELAEFQKWSDVNQWALPLFSNAAPLSTALTRQITEWKRLRAPEERVVAALDFVENEIQLAGNENAGSEYKLADPSAVFERRSGDAKDKNFLFISIARELKIEANPVLVNTRIGPILPQMHPSPMDFDRVVAQVQLDGQTYWLDAADIYARGPLAVRTLPNYEYGLAVRPGTTALTAIPPSRVAPRTTLTQYIELGSTSEPSKWRVVTVAEGTDAERLREQYAMVSHDDMASAHLSYYAKLYPGIELTRPMIYSDNEQENRVRVEEFYRVPMWTQTDGEGFFRCRIEAANLAMAMVKPALETRTMPLGVAYPEHRFFRAELLVRRLALVKPEEQTIENPAFFFHRQVMIRGERLLLEYEYRSLAGAVLPEAMPAYATQLNAAFETLSYCLSSN